MKESLESNAIPLPPAFRERISRQLGDQAGAYFSALGEDYVRGIRLNSLKPCNASPEGLLEPVPWNPSGYYLTRESAAGAHPLHEAGGWYIQEPSAMAPVAVLNPQPGERILDLCAAPGGKSTQIGEVLRGEGLLVSNEPVPSRGKILSRNLERMGIPNALTVCADPDTLAPLWPEAFDAVLVDAPCSGEGMFRRHPETRLEWQPTSPRDCAQRQKRILSAAVQMLRPGGRLVYSTCTFNPEENEEVMEETCKRFPCLHSVPFSLPAGDGKTLSAPEGMLHLFPHEIRGEGHFVALLRKEGEGRPGTLFAPASTRLGEPTREQLAAWRGFAPLSPNARWEEELLLCPDLPTLKGVRVLRAGLKLGTLKGKVFIPDHALALSPCLKDFPSLPLTPEEAVLYQSGQVLPWEEGRKGWVLLTLEGLALGFGKAGEGMVKNHYPKGLRRGG